MKVDFIVERETEKAFEVCTHVGYVQSGDKYSWVPKSICTWDERGGDIHPELYGAKKYKHISYIADWWCWKNLK